MSVLGKNTLSIRKKDVKEQKSIGVGFKKIVFAHKATLGETGINLTALVAPSEMSSVGFVNPNSSELTDANLLFYRKNLTIISSVKGPLVDFLSYTVPSSSRIAFNGFTAEDGEIFVGVIDPSAKTELRAVDASALVATGTLAVGVTDFNAGTPFEINKYPLTQLGSVIVFRNGVQQFRNTGNTATPDGNYYEVSAGGGLGTVIRFNNAPVGIDDNILVVSNGLLVERPDGSMMAAIENIAGQLDQVIPTVAALAGVPETDFQSAPNNVDLKAFGDSVLAMLDAQVPIITDWANYTPVTNITGNLTTTGRWRRVGGDMELQLMITMTVGGPNPFSTMEIGLPSGYTIDTAKILSTTLSMDHFGTGAWFDDSGGTTRWIVEATYVNNTTLEMRAVIQVTGASTIVHVTDITNTSPFAPGSGDIMVARVKVPITNWAATQTLREQLGL